MMAPANEKSPIIRVRGLNKFYDLRKVSHPSFKEAVTEMVKGWFGQGRKKSRKRFQALKDISFDLYAGEVLGIIGDNGAGKSSLLSIIGQVSAPDSGTVELYGTVASILEVGTGFHPELTGRENVFLSGSLLGMSREDIAARFEEILLFSGIGDFIDVPVKKYSSGMFMRLAFSVIAHLDADILLLDEVFSVGDVDFRNRSRDKILELARSGRSIIFVSHQMAAVMGFCDRCLILEKGNLKSIGEVADLVSIYMESSLEKRITGQDQEMHISLSEESQYQPSKGIPTNEAETEQEANEVEPVSEAPMPVLTTSLKREWEDNERAPGNGQLRILSISCDRGDGPGERSVDFEKGCEITIQYRKLKAISSVICLMLTYQGEEPFLISHPLLKSPSENGLGETLAPGNYQASVRIPGFFLNKGIYSVELYFISEEAKELLYLPGLLNFKVQLPDDSQSRFYYSGKFPGPVFTPLDWTQSRSE